MEPIGHDQMARSTTKEEHDDGFKDPDGASDRGG